MRICPDCHEECGDEANFCGYCGAVFEQPPLKPEPAEHPPVPVSGAVSAAPADEASDSAASLPEAAAYPVRTPPDAMLPAPPADCSAVPAPYAPQYTYYAAPYFRPRPAGPVINAVRDAGGSVFMLVAAILSVICLFVGVYQSIVQYRDTFSFFGYDSYYDDADENSQSEIGNFAASSFDRYGITRTTSLMTVFGMINNNVPLLVLSIGLWLFYASCKNREKELKTTGLTLLKVFAIIKLCAEGYSVLSYILAIVATFGGGLLFSVIGWDVQFLTGIFMLLWLLAIAVSSVSIVYFSKIITTTGKLSRTVSTGIPNQKISLFVVVCNFVYVLVSLFFALQLPVTLIGGEQEDFPGQFLAAALKESLPSVAISILTAALLVFVSFVLLRYRSNMKKLLAAGF